jgi:hypothetical protein
LRLLLYLSISIFAYCLSSLESYISKQDPLVEEAFRVFFATSEKQRMEYKKIEEEVGKNIKEIYEKLFENPDDNPIVWWEKGIYRLKEIEKQISGRQPSQAIVDNIIAFAYGELLGSSMNKLVWTDPEVSKIFMDIVSQTNNPQEGFAFLYSLSPNYVDEMIYYFERGERYNPELSVAHFYIKETGEVYYIVSNLRDQSWEEREWGRMVREMLEMRGIKEESIVSGGVGSYRPAIIVTAYLAKRDYAKAIYYLELVEELYGGPILSSQNSLAMIRRKYLQQLKNKGVGDNLHPFVYINGKVFNTSKSFTKDGEPFVSVNSFLNMLNIPSEWIKEGKILKISKDNDICYIANIKGKWRVYKGKEKKDIEVYLKDEEIYLPLKELCELLGLKLQWDEETYIGRVISGSIGK